MQAVRREAAAILSLPAESLQAKRALAEYGLDSLMAVELRNALATLAGMRLPSSLLFDYPNLEALAGHLGERLAPATPTTPVPPAEVPSPSATLSPDELTEALNQELKRAGY